MLIPFVLFVILIVWGLIDTEIYAKEAIILGAIWLICLFGYLFLRSFGFYFVVPMALIDIYLLVKMTGSGR